MTDAQKFKFYFPAWNTCVKANGWHSVKGVLQFDGSRLSAEASKVFTFARQRAVMAKRPLKIDDVRHGAHWLALGKDKSSEHLTNAELDRVVALFRVLADPDDLGARMKWDAFQRGEDPGAMTRLDHFIRNAAPDAYVRKVAEGICHTRNWEDCTTYKKQELARALSQRRKNFRKPISQKATKQTHELTYAASGDPDWSVE